MWVKPPVSAIAFCFSRPIPATFRMSSVSILPGRATLIASILPAMPPKLCAPSKALAQSARTLPYEKISFRRRFLCCAHSRVAMGLSGENLVASIAAITGASWQVFKGRYRRWDARPRNRHHDAPAPYRLFLRNYRRPATGTAHCALEFIARHAGNDRARITNIAKRLLGPVSVALVRANRSCDVVRGCDGHFVVGYHRHRNRRTKCAANLSARGPHHGFEASAHLAQGYSSRVIAIYH